MFEIGRLFYWAAVLAFGGATIAFGLALVFEKKAVWRVGVLIAFLAFAALTVALALRWAETGHGPYLGRYEAMGSYGWTAATLYLILQTRMERLRPAGILVAPIVFFLLGLGITSPGGPQFESPAMRSTWLWFHVGTVKVALASLVLASSLSLAYLLRHRPARRPLDVGTPSAVSMDLEWLEELSTTLTSVGFFALAVALAAGAMWAKTAWGAYWNWDPIETWALSTWLLYGLLLHGQRMWGVSGNRWAWMSLGALGLAAGAFVFVRLVSLSPHWIYVS